MTNKKKIGKVVWIDGYLWKIEQILSPNKYNDFLIISRKSEGGRVGFIVFALTKL